jgi:hypothetical protein
MTEDSPWALGLLTTLLAIFAVLMISAASSLSEAAEVVDRTPIGPHVPILTLEKNENPQNLLIVFTKVDDACRFQIKDREPILSDYWLIDRAKYKPVHPLIQRGIGKRISVVSRASGDPNSFQVRLNDFTELRHDLGNDPLITVKSAKTGGKCEAKAVVQLGPSDQNRSILLETVVANSKKKALPPFRELLSLTLKGIDLESGAEVSRTYVAK